MSPSQSFLAIDLGAESGRAIIGTLENNKLRLTELHRFANGPVGLPDGLHWDVLHLWTQIKESISLAVRQYGQSLASLGLDTWGVDFALLDRQGNLLSNPHHYRDSRTDGMMAEAFRHMPRQQIFEFTGIQFMQINTLYQLLALVTTRAPVLEAAETFLTIPDLFNYWLTGQKVCEFSNATTTQCYDPRQCDWAWPVLDALNIPRRIFPPVVQPGAILGSLQPALAVETGAAGLPVIAPACHDTGSAVAAVPASAPRFAWISSGTWSIMGTEAPEPVINPESERRNFTNEGGVAGTYRFSKNILGLWLLQECRRAWAAAGQEFSYSDLTEMAALAAPLVTIIDPDDDGFLRPGDMPERIRAFCRRTQQPVPENIGAVVRCILESIALKYRWVLDNLEELAGCCMEPIHIIGGGTKNQLLNQFTADATGRRVVAGPVEATATGNILVQAIATGQIASLQEARAIVQNSFTPLVYEPSGAPGWEDAYVRLKTLFA